jgi:hypothetical protein
MTRREWETIKIADFERLEAEVRMLRAALQPFAHHSLGGFWTESERKLRIRVTEGQLCRAWMALNNPHWIDEWEQES